eukprot:CAMPEP_0177717202 /NCGR_PEP_ID=MMETSP0484_2-20121128/14909_1 /TAXON_ID=354590 /ORGANISM="Rhodomonas lens, Strain RHODO" /LENGTH=400 /DNA_ID=CAMNT_0019229267 /DNA_START=210 /DNA_END=1412 /DNA_ORIENTATION=-
MTVGPLHSFNVSSSPEVSTVSSTSFSAGNNVLSAQQPPRRQSLLHAVAEGSLAVTDSLSLSTVRVSPKSNALCTLLKKYATAGAPFPGRIVMDPPLCGQDSTGNLLSNAARSSVFLDCSASRDTGGVQHAAFSPANFTPEAAVAGNLAGDWKMACEACRISMRHECRSGLEMAVPQIQSSLRGLAQRWRAAAEAEAHRTGTKLELDDAVVYLRCGDILKQPWHSGYGWVQYRVYADTLHPETSTIGIVTTPFENGVCRAKDCDFRRDCERIVGDLAAFLEWSFPRSRVVVRNGKEETVQHAFARMVLARQVICNPSTFCLYPTIASTGRGYIVASRLYPWVELLDRATRPEASIVQVLHQPFLSMSMIKKITGRVYNPAKPWSDSEFALIASWLRNGSVD